MESSSSLNIEHICYFPVPTAMQHKSLVFSLFLGDVLSKLIEADCENWKLIQVLVVKFLMNVITKFLSYLLKPLRKSLFNLEE